MKVFSKPKELSGTSTHPSFSSRHRNRLSLHIAMNCFERFFVTKSKPSLVNPHQSQPEYYNLMPATSKQQQQRRDPTGRSMDSSRWSLNQQEVVQQPLIDDQVEQKIYIYQKFLLKSHHTARRLQFFEITNFGQPTKN